MKQLLFAFMLLNCGCDCGNKVYSPPIVSQIKKDGTWFVYVCDNVKIDVYSQIQSGVKIGDTLFFTVRPKN